jgi:probable F420-dependent oxidoreductase
MAALTWGLCGLNIGPLSFPDPIVRIAQAAEAAGWGSLWVAEHVVLPDPQVSPSPMAPTDRILDPVIALTWLAAHTRRVRLGSGIIILPQRNPLVLAKELASLDVLSQGRLIVGVGAGYLEPEFRAIGVSLAERGQRTDEYLAALRTIWGDAQPAYHGRFVDFANVQAYPRPVQQPTPPFVIGGHSAAAHRRAVEQAHGWYGYGLDLSATEAAVAGLRDAEARYGRPTELGPLEISITPPGPLDRATVERYAELGVDQLILRLPRTTDLDVIERFVHEEARALFGTA